METAFLDKQREKLDCACENLKTKVRDGEARLHQAMETAKVKARHALDQADHVVREKPYETLGVCFGAGLIIGLLGAALVARRSKHRSARFTEMGEAMGCHCH